MILVKFFLLIFLQSNNIFNLIFKNFIICMGYNIITQFDQVEYSQGTRPSNYIIMSPYMIYINYSLCAHAKIV